MKQFFLTILIALCFINPAPKVSLPQLEIGNATIKIEIADTETERTQGLSDRTNLAPDTGLLFIFPTITTPNFWMKDMFFPIDIIWLDENWKIIGIEKNLTPETYPKLFFPPSPIKYVLEVNAGFSTKNNLKTGDQVKDQRSPR